MTVVASNYARRENDLYQTEPWATRAMLKHVPIGHRSVVWEPSAGNQTRAKISVAKKGQTKSPEARAKISASKKGKPRRRYAGKPWPPERGADVLQT